MLEYLFGHVADAFALLTLECFCALCVDDLYDGFSACSPMSASKQRPKRFWLHFIATNFAQHAVHFFAGKNHYFEKPLHCMWHLFALSSGVMIKLAQRVLYTFHFESCWCILYHFVSADNVTKGCQKGCQWHMQKKAKGRRALFFSMLFKVILPSISLDWISESNQQPQRWIIEELYELKEWSTTRDENACVMQSVAILVCAHLNFGAFGSHQLNYTDLPLWQETNQEQWPKGMSWYLISILILQVSDS